MGGPPETYVKCALQIVRHISDVLLAGFIRVSEDEFQSLGREEGVKLPGGGYLGTLMVYHHFHCLVFARPHKFSSIKETQSSYVSATITLALVPGRLFPKHYRGGESA
jgi:hypothetical protein